MPGMDHGDMDMDNGEADGHDHSEADHDSFDDVPEDFRAQLTEAIEIYIQGKDAFIDSDLEEASSAFEEFISKLEEIGEHGLSGSGHEAWMESYHSLTETAAQIIESDDVDEARSPFRTLSDELIAAVQMFGIDGAVYHQYCPMAFDDEGATWLSTEEQIRNPYLPDTMMGCGGVIERIEH